MTSKAMVEPLNTKAWCCRSCGSTLFSRIDAMQPNGQFGPSDHIRCVECKTVDYQPRTASPSLPVVDGGEVVATSWKYHDRVYVDFKFAPDPYALERGFLTDIEPLVRQSALLAAESRVLSLEEEVKRLRRLGDTLSNITFNLAQPSSPLTNDQKVVMREAVTQWDAGRAALKENGA